jgi:hypothetical protein
MSSEKRPIVVLQLLSPAFRVHHVAIVLGGKHGRKAQREGSRSGLQELGCIQMKGSKRHIIVASKKTPPNPYFEHSAISSPFEMLGVETCPGISAAKDSAKYLA